jgi:Flp pilus assembly protein TadG
MALLLPMLLLLLLGIIEFGYVFFVDLSLTNAVREGARVGATIQESNNVAATAEAEVQEYINDVLGESFVAALDTNGINLDTATNKLEVIATINNYPDLSPFQLLSSNLLPSNISARAVMRWEY